MGSPPTMFPVFYCALFLGAFTAANGDTVTVSQSEEETIKDDCPSGWTDATYVGMGCLRFDSSKSYTWDKAHGFCTTVGGHLVEIKTEGELKFIRNQLDVLDDHEAAYNWWTSGTDIGVDGNWFWSVSLSKVEDYIWSSNQPNGNGSENCLVLYHSYSYMAHDYDCAAGYMPICQKNATTW